MTFTAYNEIFACVVKTGASMYNVFLQSLRFAPYIIFPRAWFQSRCSGLNPIFKKCHSVIY